MSSNIHPTAIIADSAQIDPTTTIGAYCIIGDNVQIGANCVLKSHVVITRDTVLGARNTVHSFASLGDDAQDLKYGGEPTTLIIGDDNTIREACSLHRGTGAGLNETRIGNGNLLMVNTHIAHDCVIGDNNVFANNVGIAGHVVVGDEVIVGGNVGVHQFCKINSYSFIGGATLVTQDVAAFVMVSGNPAKTYNVNKEGMRRRGWTRETIATLIKAYHLVFRSGLLLAEAKVALLPLIEKEPKVALLLASLDGVSKRGLLR